jgi:hypothetical protein
VALGKADRAPYDTKNWHSFGNVCNFPNHFEVTFNDDPMQIPTLGANGIAVRNRLLKKYPMYAGLHTEMCMNFIHHGYNKFAFIKNTHIVHEISADIITFCKRRLQWATLYSSSNIPRDYKVFSFPQDALKLLVIVIISFTFIIPFLRAVKGYIYYRHTAWFLHPIILFIFVISYGIQVLTTGLSRLKQSII